jgi:hypothetical protein
MAIDTRDKRMSMIGLASPFVRRLKSPSGSVDATARAMLLFLYSGLLPDPPPVSVPRVIALLASRSNRVELLASRTNTVTLLASKS